MDDALKVIKSLITTSTDGGLLVNDINKEYKEMVGKAVPFQEFGFTTLTEFLRSTNEFSGTKTENGIKVTIKIPGKSAHIIAMRQKQNVSQAEKKRRKKSMMKSRIGGTSISSQQLKRSIPSQVMKRNSGIVTKQRTRAQPQRIASSDSMPPPQLKSTSTQTSNTNRPPVNTVTNPMIPSQKVNIHDRFVPKQFSDPEIPSTKSMPMMFVPSTPPTSPVQSHCTLPQMPSTRSKLMARLDVKKISTPSESSQTNSSDSDTRTVVDRFSLQTSSVGRLSRSELLARLAPKQLPSPIRSPIGRSALQKICQNLDDQEKKCSLENAIQSHDARLQTNQSSSSISDHKQKPFEAVPLSKTISRRDLYARLAAKVNESKNETNPIGSNLVQLNHKLLANTIHSTSVNQTNKKIDLSSRLQPKQIDMESPELQQINQKLNDMNLMQVNGVANERIAIPLNGVQKFDLSGRLQKKQYEMDWEQINWVRSVKASDRQIKVTVNFT